MWHVTSDIMGIFVLSDFESMAKYWLRGKNITLLIYFSLLFFGPSGKLEMIFAFREHAG
jgi:hypothetical protein